MSAIPTTGGTIADRLRMAIGRALWWFIEPVKAKQLGEFRSLSRENRLRLKASRRPWADARPEGW